MSHTTRNQPDNRRDYPDGELITSLMRKYGEALLERCPASETIVLFAEDPALIDDSARKKLNSHLTICLDCQDKIKWLQKPAYEDSIDSSNDDRISTYLFRVQIPVIDVITDGAPLAYAAGSWKPNPSVPDVPYIVSTDGAFFAEIGQDFNDQLFLYLVRLPSAFQWHALKVRAVTKESQVFETPTRTLGQQRINIVRRREIHPTDFDRIELQFTNLRPR